MISATFDLFLSFVVQFSVHFIKDNGSVSILLYCFLFQFCCDDPFGKRWFFRIIFIKICHKNGYKFHWKTRGSFLEFALIDVEVGNNCKQCSIYITFRREEQVTWPLAPGFILSTSKESLILRLQCINYKYHFSFSLSWCLFIFGLFVLCYLNVKITRASTCSRMQH